MSTETFAAPDTTIEHRSDGAIILRARRELGDLRAVDRGRAAGEGR